MRIRPVQFLHGGASRRRVVPARWIGWMAALWLGIPCPTADPAPARPESPTADEIVQRLLERAETLTNRMEGVCLGCRRLTVLEELDSRGNSRERKLKEHLVAITGRGQKATLVQMDGKPLSESDRRREERREEGHRDKFGSRKERSSRQSQALDRALLERFRYRLVGMSEMEGRRTYELGFEPIAGGRDGKVADRVLGRLQGRLWVDADEFEPVRIEAELSDPVSIGGFLAVMDQFRMTVVRRRLPSGYWVDERVDTHVGGRRLVQRFHGHMEVTQDQFAVVPSPDPDTGGAAQEFREQGRVSAEAGGR
ncbi:MAG: hypothetical protein JNL10_13275 [Verrucomicrobiales bacterium]|nr:hypothetical protein [Verrucomicrobiales bacterium]